MVALAPITNETPAWDVLDRFPKLHSRAREVKTPSCTDVPHSKSLGCVEIWLVIYEGCDGLESFTRDPIGYRGSPFDLYEYCESSPLQNFDPLGMETWVCSGQMSNIKTFTLEEVDKDGCTMTSKITLRAQRCFRDGLIGNNDPANFFAEIQFDTTITKSCPCQPSKSWKTYRYCRAPLGVFIKPTLDDYGRGFDPNSTNVDDFRDAFCPGVQTLPPG